MTQQKTDRTLSRRGILAGLGAGGAAAVAAVVTTGNPAEAAPGAPVVIGANNDAGATTTTLHSTVNAATLDVENTNIQSSNLGTIAVKAHSTLGTGVDAAGFDNGVLGFSSDGNGVVGSTDIGYGVIGTATGAGAVAVVASAPQVEGTTALSVRGFVNFTRSGVATVAANATSVVVSGLTITDGSRALATAQRNTAVWVKAAVPNSTAGTLTLVLNSKAPSGGVPIVWLLIEA